MAATRAVEEVDVVVVGGGPAGATTAALVAMAGHRVLLLEGKRFPRYQVGESLVPTTTQGIARLLGVNEALRQSAFTVRGGTALRWGSSPEPWHFPFEDPAGAQGRSHAYQVERSRFDALLLDNARRVGVAVREECVVSGVLRDGERVEGIRYRDILHREHRVRAQYVVDASGHGSRLYPATGGERVFSRFFRNIAVFGYYEGGHRLPAAHEGGRLCAAFSTGWMWYVPLANGLTGVGAVVNREHVDLIRDDLQRALPELVAACPPVRDLLVDARPVSDGDYGPVRIRKDYSYSNTRLWSPGLALVGDSACFVDPLSSGVHLATYSALLAARSINSALSGRVAEKRAFEEFEARYRHEYRLIHNLLAVLYDMNNHEDSYFWTSRRITRTRASDLVSFLNLVGGVSSGDAWLRSSARTATKLSEASQLLDRLGHGADAEDVVGESEVLQDIWQQRTQLAHAMRSGCFAEREPMLADGLLATSDGVHWIEPS